jgi:hypothetical protein
MGFLTSTKNSQTSHTGKKNTTPLQAKLRYGQEGDSHEHEADRVADAVKSNSRNNNSGTAPSLGSSISNFVQRKKVEENKNTLQAKSNKQDDLIQKKPTSKQEEKPVQKSSVGKEEKPVQKKPVVKERESALQKKTTDTPREEKKVQKKKSDDKIDELPVQKLSGNLDQHHEIQKSASNNPKAEDPSVEADILASKNGGDPMPDDLRIEMEHQFGVDFSAVKIHNNSSSYSLCRRINALAFTHGNHIYFADGKFEPDTADGKHLIAHELTHVVQQGEDIKKNVVQKSNSPSKSASKPEGTATDTIYEHPVKGTIDKKEKKITIPELRIPKFKKEYTKFSKDGLTIREGREEGEKRKTDQRTIWEKEAKDGAGLKSKFNKMFNEAHAFGNMSDPVKYFKVGHGESDKANFLVGKEDVVRTRLLRPFWKQDGKGQAFEVDHQLEYQLGGPDEIGNLWLLERKANGSSGSNIANEIKSKVNSLLEESSNTLIWNGRKAPEFPKVKREYSITFQKGKYDLQVESDGPPDSYDLKEIRDGKQLENISPMDFKKVRTAGLTGDATHLVIFNNRTGGKRFILDIANAKAGEVPFSNTKFLPGFKPTSALITPEQQTIVTLKGKLWSDNKLMEGHGMPIEVPISKMEDIPNTGVLNVRAFSKKIEEMIKNGMKVKPFSPVRLSSCDVDDDGNILILGKIITDIPIIDGADIDIAIRGNDIRIEKTFYGDEFKLPGPVKIPQSSITFAIGSESGISVSGSADIEIKNVAEGKITANAQTGTGANSSFSISGYLDFDTEKFKPARLTVKYENKILTIGGELGIQPGKITGVKTASIIASYSNEGNFSATGNAELDVRGISKLILNASYSNEQLLIESDATLTNEIPGIRSGMVHVKILKTGDNWQVSASGTAQPAIPGIDSSLGIEFDNGALKIEGHASYNRGLLSGSVNIGATNRAIIDGQPSGPPTDKFILYGGGNLTVQLTPWLKGTVGVSFSPAGEMTVSGKIGIPNPLEVFPVKRMKFPILPKTHLDIPIFAISLGVTSIGLVARLGWHLDAFANLGPGTLQQLELGIEYSPEHPENTVVTGHGLFVVGAEAGLQLKVNASIALDALVGGVEGGMVVSGKLALQSNASAGVDINWTPSSGLVLDAKFSETMSPVFKFYLGPFVRAWLGPFDWEWEEELANYKFGSGLELGVDFPIHYKEGEGVNVNEDEIHFRRPDINVFDTIKGLVNSVI